MSKTMLNYAKNPGKMTSINVEGKGPAWSREQWTRWQRHFVTLRANLSGFPCNPDWVEKQARDFEGKERVRWKPKSWKSSLKTSSKIEKEEERWAIRFKRKQKRAGSESSGKGFLNSISFSLSILVCQFVSSLYLENQGGSWHRLPSWSQYIPLHT